MVKVAFQFNTVQFARPDQAVQQRPSLASVIRPEEQSVFSTLADYSQGVAVGRENWLFADSDSGGEHVVVLYSLIGTCRLTMWSQKNGCVTSLDISW